MASPGSEQPAGLARAFLGQDALLRRGLPLLLLLTALATLFPALIESGPLHELRRNHHHLTFDHLAVAKNLAPERGWLAIYRQTVDDDGEAAYVVYHRFPPLGYFLIKLATLTQGGDLAGEIQAARMLMLALYSGAAVLAYLSVATLTGRRYVALAATLTAFSSYALLHACDIVATEGTVDLFGTMLALHGIAHYQRSAGARDGEGPVAAKPRFAQLLAKAAVALLLGWHVLAFLGPFVVLGLTAAAAGRDWAECRRLAAFGGLVLLFGLTVLAYNFAREYFALGNVAVWDLPGLESMRRRSIWGTLLGEPVKTPVTVRMWAYAGEDQLHRIGLALAPYLATGLHLGWRGWTVLGALGCAGIAAMGVTALIGRAPRARSTCLALAPLAAGGILWATAMVGNQRTWRTHVASWANPLQQTYDTYEAMFHVGAPLALMALLSLMPPPAAWSRRRRDLGGARQLMAAASAATLWLMFVSSAWAIGQLHRDPKIAQQERALLADVAVIRDLAADKRIFAAGPIWQHFVSRPRPPGRKRFYFTDRVLIQRPERAARFADVATGPRIPGAKTLTPDNRFYFLYSMDEYKRVCAARPATAVALRRWCENPTYYR